MEKRQQEQNEIEPIRTERAILEESVEEKEGKLSKRKEATRTAKNIAGRAKNIALKRVAPKIQDAAERAAGDIQEKAIPLARKGIEAAQEKADDLILEAKKKYHNPVFRNDLSSPDFCFPKLIEIVDPSDKHPFLEEQNACGWLSKEGDMQVLHVFRGEAPECGLSLHPFVATDAFYYKDPIDPFRYINLANYYDIIRDEKETELRSIAYDLGAKKCTLECDEASIQIRSKQWKAKASTKPTAEDQASIETQYEANQEKRAKRHVLFIQEYEGNQQPRKPKLYWYQNDPQVALLIRTRCANSGEGTTSHLKCRISDSSSRTISVKVAKKIDQALKKMNMDANVSFEGQAKDEMRKKLTFIVDF